jgi:chemotaxis protein CheZ
MHPQGDMMDHIMDKVTEQVVGSIKEILAQVIEKELTTSLTRSLVESEFYRKISDDMRGGLQSIYKEIAQATRPESKTHVHAPVTDKKQAQKLFSEASEQLDEILTTTEKAAFEIMDVVEKHMELQSQSNEMLNTLRKTRKSNPSIQKLININDDLGQNLVTIMTSLSFQDLTGQRIKRIITALKKIEITVFDLYLSTGLLIRAREEAPEKDLDQLQQEAKQKVNELKGPKSDVSQANIDDMLAHLGL